MTTSKPWPSNHCMCNWVQLLPINWTSNQNRPCRPLPHSPHFSLSLSLDVNCYVCKDCHLSLLFHVITLQTNLKVKLLFVHDVPPPQPLATLLVNDMHRSSPRVVLISSSPVVHSRLLVWNAVLWQSPLTNTRAIFVLCTSRIVWLGWGLNLLHSPLLTDMAAAPPLSGKHKNVPVSGQY